MEERAIKLARQKAHYKLHNAEHKVYEGYRDLLRRQIAATAALLACCTDSGTATATGAAWAVCALRHSFITALAAFISTRAARRTASTVGMVWRPDCSKRSAAAAMMRSRTKAECISTR